MKANKDSVHAKLYNFTYSGNLPNNLCPYFWKLVAAFLLFIPNFIIQLPDLIRLKIQKQRYWYAGDSRVHGTLIWLCIAVAILYLFTQYQWVLAMMDSYSYYEKVANIGWCLDAAILTIICGVQLGIKYLKHRESKHYEYVEKKPSIIVEFIKAKYHNYCPQIEWQDNNAQTK